MKTKLLQVIAVLSFILSLVVTSFILSMTVFVIYFTPCGFVSLFVIRAVPYTDAKNSPDRIDQDQTTLKVGYSSSYHICLSMVLSLNSPLFNSTNKLLSETFVELLVKIRQYRTRSPSFDLHSLIRRYRKHGFVNCRR